MEKQQTASELNEQRSGRYICTIGGCARYEPSAMDRLWIAEEMGIHIEWPGRIFVDNAAGVSFQNGTNPNSKLKGIFDLREQWVKELRDKRRVRDLYG